MDSVNDNHCYNTSRKPELNLLDIRKEITAFLLKLKTLHNLKEVDLQAIVEHENNLISSIFQCYVDKEDVSLMLDCAFSNLQTSHRRKNTFSVCFTMFYMSMESILF